MLMRYSKKYSMRLYEVNTNLQKICIVLLNVVILYVLPELKNVLHAVIGIIYISLAFATLVRGVR